MYDLENIRFRLNEQAEKSGDQVPEPILSADGAPSRETMAFCNKHSLTLDWVILGAEPVYRKSKTPALCDIEYDAITLHALLEGLDLLMSEAESNASPASNAAHVLAQQVIDKCARLAEDLTLVVDAHPEGRSALGQV